MSDLIQQTENGRGQEVKAGCRVRHVRDKRQGVLKCGYLSPSRQINPHYVWVQVQWADSSRVSNVRLDSLEAAT